MGYPQQEVAEILVRHEVPNSPPIQHPGHLRRPPLWGPGDDHQGGGPSHGIGLDAGRGSQTFVDPRQGREHRDPAGPKQLRGLRRMAGTGEENLEHMQEEGVI